MAVGVGIIGCGEVMSRFHLPECLKAKNVRFIATCDVQADKARSLADQLGAKDVYSDYKELIGNPLVEAVIICTPNYLHHSMTVEAARAGKHVLVEKPMAMSLREADDMIYWAEQNNVILMVEQRERFMPLREATRDILMSNILGKIESVYVRVGHGGPEYWSPTGKWFFSKEKAGGGAMIDLGIHGADLILFSTQKRPKEVYGEVRTLEKNIEVDDHGICIINLDDDSLAVLEASWILKPVGEASLTAYCERGWLEAVARGTDCFLRYYKGTSPQEASQVIDVPLPRESRYGGPILHFFDCVNKNEVPSVTGLDGRAALQIVLGAYESSLKGRRIQLSHGEDLEGGII